MLNSTETRPQQSFSSALTVLNRARRLRLLRNGLLVLGCIAVLAAISVKIFGGPLALALLVGSAGLSIGLVAIIVEYRSRPIFAQAREAAQAIAQQLGIGDDAGYEAPAEES